MGNADSHGSSASPARFSSRREEVSPRSWWRSRGRSYPDRHTYQHTAKWSRRGLGAGSQRHVRGERGYEENGGGSNGSRGEQTSTESGGSPKVLLSKDGSMRVEFTNARVDPPGPASAPPGPEASLRTSKGSSLSSDGSWYDSPWGAGGELADSVFICGEGVANSSRYATYSSDRTEEKAIFSATVDISPGFNSRLLLLPATETAAGYNSCSSGRTEDNCIGDSVIPHPDLRDFPRHNTLPAFPTAPDAAALLDDVIQEEEGSGGVAEQARSSLMLPCRRAGPASRNGRKDSLKSRIRWLSDWTGSLSRKKRRIQVRNAATLTFSSMTQR